jgi:acetyl esterase/lipase
MKNFKIKTLTQFIIFGVNLIALVCGIAYLINPEPYLLWNLYGCVVILALIGNNIMTCAGVEFRYLDYAYLLLSNAGMLIIPVLNTLASSSLQNKTSQSITVLVLFNVIFLFGVALSCIHIKRDEKDRKLNPERNAQSGRLKNILRWVAVVILFLQLPAGIFISYILLGKSTGNMIEVFISEYAVFWGLAVFCASVLIIKLRWRNKGSAFNKIILSLGSVICAICLLPLASVPFMIRKAESAYQEAFGNAYLEDKTISVQNGFMKYPFSLQDYFFVPRSADYIVKENVLYYEGTTGKDAGLKLYFDAYMPVNNNGNPSEQYSVLIRIHGGSWTMGDKGPSNYSGTNKHFANLGYAVFDIQYGLSNRNASFASSVVPSYVKGDFDIDDMMRHIGIFTTFLADHAGEYNANLDSVFISGGSAGGQLAVAAALGITSGKYVHILDSRLRVKGLIPFYPANGLPPYVGIGGTPDFVDPALLVDENSSPCLIYHGTHDGIVAPKIASALKTTYAQESGAPCALLWMTFAGHGSDFYTPGYYNQVFLYYMERFMSQYKIKRNGRLDTNLMSYDN